MEDGVIIIVTSNHKKGICNQTKTSENGNLMYQKILVLFFTILKRMPCQILSYSKQINCDFRDEVQVTEDVYNSKSIVVYYFSNVYSVHKHL